MKKLSLILAFALLVSLFSACGNVDTVGNDGADAEVVTPSLEPTAEPSPVPSEEPVSSPEPNFEPIDRNFPDDHWSKNVADAPAVPMDGMSAPEGMVPLKDLPVDYSAEQAEADGCFGTDHRNKTKTIGTGIKNDFNDDVRAGIPAKGREYYCAPDSKYKTILPIVTDIEFDGNNTIKRQYIRDAQMQLEYEEVTINRDLEALGSDVASDYDKDAEKARKDGCILLMGYANTPLYGGEAIWNEFYNRVNSGEKASVRFFKQYDDKKLNTVSQLDFDGSYFVYTQKNRDENALISTVYTNLSEYNRQNWSALSAETLYILNYSEHYSLEYIEKCMRLYFEPFIEGNFYPNHIELIRVNSSKALTLDDYVLPDGADILDETGLSDQAHIYDILPGSEEWNALPDTLARRKATQVSKSEVKEMTANALIKTIITYPFFADIYAFNTILMGMDSMCSLNPAIEELFSRENAHYELVKFRIEHYDEIVDEMDKRCFSSLLSYYETYVMSGIHQMYQS